MAQLSEYIAGELPQSDGERVAEHLARCASCRGTAEALRLVGPTLRDISRAGSPVEAVDHTFALARAGARAVRDEGRLPVAAPDRPVDSPELPAIRRLRPWLGVAASLAAGMLLTLGMTRLFMEMSRDATDPGEPRFVARGQGARPMDDIRVDLSFSVQQTPAGPLVLGKNGWRYGQDDLLYFRCYLSHDGYLLLARVGGGEVEPLTPGGNAVPVSRGDWDLSNGTHLVAYSLEGLKGAQRFVILFSPTPFSLNGELRSLLLAGGVERGEVRADVIADSIGIELPR